MKPSTRKPSAPLARLGAAALVAALAVSAWLALASGPMTIDGDHVLGALGIPLGATPSPVEAATVIRIRLPRMLLALLVGAALAMSGAAMQSLMRNPLADPGLIGVSSGAALAAATMTVCGAAWGLSAALGVPVAAFAGGMAAAWLVMRLGQVDGRTRVGTLLLAGLALNALAGAGISLLSYSADDTALRAVTFWMFGSLASADLRQVAIAAPLLLLVLIALPVQARALDALLLGEAEAQHLGVQVESVKRRVVALIVLAVGTSVALCGVIAFVGLIVPNLARLASGPRHRRLLPASAALGATLLLIADIAARRLYAPADLPIGILTALVGAPFFLAMLMHYRNRPELA